MATHRDVPYKTAEELSITEHERLSLINVIPVLLAEPKDFSMSDFGHCIAGCAKLSGRLQDVSPVLWRTLYQGQGKCWSVAKENPLGPRTALAAAAATTAFLSGSD